MWTQALSCFLPSHAYSKSELRVQKNGKIRSDKHYRNTLELQKILEFLFSCLTAAISIPDTKDTRYLSVCLRDRFLNKPRTTTVVFHSLGNGLIRIILRHFHRSCPLLFSMYTKYLQHTALYKVSIISPPLPILTRAAGNTFISIWKINHCLFLAAKD